MQYDDNLKMFSSLDEFDDCDRSSLKCIFDCYRRFQDDIAFISLLGKKLIKVSYSEFVKNSYKCGKYLQRKVNAPVGSVVCLAIDNSVEWCYAFWGIVMNGFIPYLTSSKNVSYPVGINIVATIADSQDCIPIDLSVISKENIKDYSPTDWSNAVYFHSSGTSGGGHVVSYDAEALIHQLQAAKTFNGRFPSVIYPKSTGRIRNLALLPFYHIFGFVAVYLWYTFFGKTLVFSRIKSLTDISYVCKKAHVTHLFAVPTVWMGIYQKSNALINEAPPVKQILIQRALNAGVFGDPSFRDKNVTWLKDRLLGRSIKLCISGGSYLDPSIQKKINAIYPLANGYGMTELGVIAVETSTRSERQFGTIGTFLHGVEPRLEGGELVVDCRFAGRDVLTGKSYEKNFYTGDVFRYSPTQNQYSFLGRKKDVYVGDNGENLSIDAIETDFATYLGALGYNFALFVESDDTKQYISLAIEGKKGQISHDDILKITDAVAFMNAYIGPTGHVHKVYSIGTIPKTANGKISRASIAKAVGTNDVEEIDLPRIQFDSENRFSQRADAFDYVRTKIANLCGIDKDSIRLQDNFFIDCGGNSLMYFDLILDIENKFKISIPRDIVLSVPTIGDLCKVICEADKV